MVQTQRQQFYKFCHERAVTYELRRVTGIYETNLSEYFDSKIIISDIRLIQKLNDWPDSLAGGLEVFVKNVDRVDDAGYAIQEAMGTTARVKPTRRHSTTSSILVSSI